MVSSNQLKGVDNLATTKNITMKQFNGTDYDTLYPKTIASQIPDVYSKTNTITATTLSQLGLSADKLPNDAFQQIKTLIDNVQSSTDSKARIQIGSYVGTGTYGADNPCSLTFDFAPQIVIITAPKINVHVVGNFLASNGSTVACIGATYNNMRSNYIDANIILQYSLTGNTLSWYELHYYIGTDGYGFDGSEAQFNDYNETYHYIAFG